MDMKEIEKDISNGNGGKRTDGWMRTHSERETLMKGFFTKGERIIIEQKKTDLRDVLE